MEKRIEQAMNIPTPSLEKYKKSPAYEKLLTDTIFISQDEAGSLLKKYLFDANYGEEAEAVYILATYLQKNNGDKEGITEISKELENLKKYLFHEKARDDFKGSEGMAGEYYQTMSKRVCDYILNELPNMKAPDKLIEGRINNIKSTILRDIKQAEGLK